MSATDRKISSRLKLLFLLLCARGFTQILGAGVNMYSTQLKGEDWVAWTRPGGQRETGRGFTQPSLHFSAKYCTWNDDRWSSLGVLYIPWPVSLTNSSEQLSLTKKNRTKIVLNNALLPWRQLPNLPTEHLNNLTWQFRAFAYLTIVQLNIYLIEHWAIEHLSIQHWFTEFRKWSQLTKYIIEQCTIEHFRVPIKANSDSNMELSLVLPIHHRSIEHFQSNNSSIFISCRQLGPLCARPGPHVRIFQLSILLILELPC